jgi:hypothetical protein
MIGAKLLFAGSMFVVIDKVPVNPGMSDYTAVLAHFHSIALYPRYLEREPDWSWYRNLLAKSHFTEVLFLTNSGLLCR